jgi:hypothetical protein
MFIVAHYIQIYCYIMVQKNSKWKYFCYWGQTEEQKSSYQRVVDVSNVRVPEDERNRVDQVRRPADQEASQHDEQRHSDLLLLLKRLLQVLLVCLLHHAWRNFSEYNKFHQTTVPIQSKTCYYSKQVFLFIM